jgi:hypothetical protein
VADTDEVVSGRSSFRPVAHRHRCLILAALSPNYNHKSVLFFPFAFRFVPDILSLAVVCMHSFRLVVRVTSS